MLRGGRVPSLGTCALVSNMPIATLYPLYSSASYLYRVQLQTSLTWRYTYYICWPQHTLTLIYTTTMQRGLYMYCVHVNEISN